MPFLPSVKYLTKSVRTCGSTLSDGRLTLKLLQIFASTSPLSEKTRMQFDRAGSGGHELHGERITWIKQLLPELRENVPGKFGIGSVLGVTENWVLHRRGTRGDIVGEVEPSFLRETPLCRRAKDIELTLGNASEHRNQSEFFDLGWRIGH